jgi:hypothetical protein
MFTAKQKRKENIAEYILYLFQVEDLIRACDLNMEIIDKQLIPQYNTDEKTSAEISDWYRNLVKMIEKEGKKQKGHLQFLVNLINEINDFHLKLMETRKVPEYIQTYITVAGLVTELKIKSNVLNNNVFICLEAVYGYLLLKIQKKEITTETQEAMERIVAWLNHLSTLYKNYEEEKLEME